MFLDTDSKDTQKDGCENDKNRNKQQRTEDS